MKKIIINKSAIEKEDISPLSIYQESWCKPSFMDWEKPAGHTCYHLYSYLAKQFKNSTFLDVGTLFGGSALALSIEPSNNVISYDIISIETHQPGALKKDNIELRVANFMEDDIDYKNIPLIVIDVDPHDGKQEPPMIEFLVEKGWEGLLLLDDIMYQQYPAMTKMWYELPYEKYDLTEIGHYSGTGLINIGKKFELEFIQGE